MALIELLVFLLALAVMALGFVGSILPGLPGAPLIVVGALGHRLLLGERGADWWVVAVLLGAAIVSIAIDYLATMIGAKTMGASKAGVLGAFVGALIGLFFGPLGLLLGPFAGALAFEKAGGRTWDDSGKAGVGAVIGLLAGAVGKLACCVAMTGLFVANVVFHWTLG